VHKDGYLMVLLGHTGCNKSKSVYEVVHRILAWARYGPPDGVGSPEGWQKTSTHPRPVVMHSCHNTACLCVAHLSWGTDQENNCHVYKKSPIAKRLHFS